MTPAAIEAIVALDTRLLAGHTEAAGDSFDPVAHRARVETALQKSRLVCVARNGVHVAHSYFWPLDPGRWFVGAFSVDPAHRNASVLGEMARAMITLMEQEGIETLESHVYKTNRLSLAFHRRLGFVQIMENDKGVALSASRVTLARSALARRALRD